MWSKTKKQLENFICDSLKNRVKFFVTQYRKSHDDHGRVCIIVDDKEVFEMCDLKYNVAVWNKQIELKQNPNNRRYSSDHSLFWKADKIVREQGIFDEDNFFEALIQYLNNPIRQSLNSQNMIVLVLALLDRRVGKRTLKEMSDKIQDQHSIVQYFYKLRCEAEGIV
jgi:hypothetical protein